MSHKKSWSRVKDAGGYGRNYDEIFRKKQLTKSPDNEQITKGNSLESKPVVPKVG